MYFVNIRSRSVNELKPTFRTRTLTAPLAKLNKGSYLCGIQEGWRSKQVGGGARGGKRWLLPVRPVRDPRISVVIKGRWCDDDRHFSRSIGSVDALRLVSTSAAVMDTAAS